ncbi:MAG: Ribosomal large subunit pseudouridine synthase, partial [Planctomycetota bacterium]
MHLISSLRRQIRDNNYRVFIQHDPKIRHSEITQPRFPIFRSGTRFSPPIPISVPLFQISAQLLCTMPLYGLSAAFLHPLHVGLAMPRRTPRQPAKNTPARSRPAGSRPRPPRVPEARGALPAIDSTPAAEEDVAAEADDVSRMRLQKFLAMSGVDSRRNCEQYIRDGRVTVDGEVITDPARLVAVEDQDIRLDSERRRLPRFRYFLLNKPKGVLCTNSDPQGRTRAVDLIPVADQRLFTVGRLDENTQGLLLLTNDGDLAQRLAHPRFEVVRRYRCHVAGRPTPEILQQLKDGMYFSEGFFRFRGVRFVRHQGRSTVLELELQEGKNREIRRLLARVGHKVLGLERIAFGPLQLGTLPYGRFRELLPTEIHLLRQFLETGELPQRPGGSFGYRPGKTRARRRKPGGSAARSGSGAASAKAAGRGAGRTESGSGRRGQA